MKSIRVILTPEAADAYHSFLSKASDSKQEEAIFNAFLQKIELLKDNVHYGQPIAKKMIPAEYNTKHGITNLFRVELPNFGECFTRLQQEVQASRSSD